MSTRPGREDTSPKGYPGRRQIYGADYDIEKIKISTRWLSTMKSPIDFQHKSIKLRSTYYIVRAEQTDTDKLLFISKT